MGSRFLVVLPGVIAALLAPAAFATSISVTGTGSVGMWGIFDFFGPQFFASSHPPGGGAGGPGWCIYGTCDLNAAKQIQAFPYFYPSCGDCGWSAGSLQGADANLLVGAACIHSQAT